MRWRPSPTNLTTAGVLAAVAILGGCGGDEAPAELAFVEAPAYYGDDVILDLYWEACDEVGGLACDMLWRRAPFGSEYEAFGAECGGRGPAISCVSSDPDNLRFSTETE